MEENIIMVPGSGTKVIVRDVKQEIETAFLDYSMSVIVARALPDVRDGLKPVHRRILYTMHERGNDPQHPYRKSADTVGAVLGSYHPHGDASVYDAMVRLAQDFSLRYPLVDGQGNFGSVDGDPPAAYRYTEARMSKMACEMLTDIEKDTIDWDPNFDETKKEPHVLPSRFPNLLVNGSQGIAVGMATNIPPHNLREIVNGMVALMDDPEIDLAGLMEYVKGPDFPTGGIIMGRSGIRAAYATGRGKITLRGRAEIIEKKNGRYEILISEIPYMVNKTRLIESIADLVKDKRIEGISDLNDESSSRTGMKIVIEIKKDANPQVVLNQLYRFTQLQDTVGVIMLALDDGVPKIMSLKTMMERYIEFQMQVIRRRTAFELKKAKEREHILEGLHKAVDIVDEIIATIRACKGGFAEARQAVMDNFGFDELQADASGDVYKYFVCAICPVKAPTLELRYDTDENFFHPSSTGHIALAPELGFLFPAFDDRAANIYNALFYSKNVELIHEEVIDAVFRVEPPMFAVEQKNVFDTALADTLEKDCSYDVVQSVHEQLRGRIQEVRERAGGTIRIATFKSVAVNWLPPMIKQFQVQHPEARFRLFDGAYAEVDAYVRSGTVDMGFISLPSELPGEIVPVCSDRLLAVLPAGHPLADRDAVPITAFGTEPVVSLVDSTNRDALRVLDAAHVHPDIRFQTADDYAMISMVESGLGICIAHELVLRSDHHNVVVRPLDPPAHRTIAMAIPPESEGKPLVRTFAAFVRAWAQANP